MAKPGPRDVPDPTPSYGTRHPHARLMLAVIVQALADFSNSKQPFIERLWSWIWLQTEGKDWLEVAGQDLGGLTISVLTSEAIKRGKFRKRRK